MSARLCAVLLAALVAAITGLGVIASIPAPPTGTTPPPAAVVTPTTSDGPNGTCVTCT
ncbi:hypothetical protein [Actinoplanes sp. NPDC051859]|uniref:hypothetical protein n=1 Tax=Actinoplanes sp. NPDC051859 TaxID=3363909 RepID=UPI00378A94A0